MVENAQSETPGQRTMRQWYQAKIGERLIQVAQMAKERSMLRRGAIKQQDGTLGSTGNPADLMDEPMNISVGDQTHYHAAPLPSEESQEQPRASATVGALAKWALAAALVGSGTAAGVGVPWLMELLRGAPTQDQPVPVDLNTQYEALLQVE